jgi:sulfur relay (sulfurtransferase) complex TusBCD TusD component (DsrE family)
LVASFYEAGHGAASPEEAYTIARKMAEAKNLLKATMSVCNAAAEMRGL